MSTQRLIRIPNRRLILRLKNATKSSNRHPHRARVDREAHGRWAYTIACAKDRIAWVANRSTTVKGGQPNDDRSAEHTRGIAMRAICNVSITGDIWDMIGFLIVPRYAVAGL